MSCKWLSLAPDIAVGCYFCWVGCASLLDLVFGPWCGTTWPSSLPQLRVVPDGLQGEDPKGQGGTGGRWTRTQRRTGAWPLDALAKHITLLCRSTPWLCGGAIGGGKISGPIDAPSPPQSGGQGVGQVGRRRDRAGQGTELPVHGPTC